MYSNKACIEKKTFNASRICLEHWLSFWAATPCSLSSCKLPSSGVTYHCAESCYTCRILLGTANEGIRLGSYFQASLGLNTHTFVSGFRIGCDFFYEQIHEPSESLTRLLHHEREKHQ